MKNLLVIFGILFSLSATASTGLVGDDAPIVLDAEELHLVNATGLRFLGHNGENSATLAIAVTYSNSCVAGTHLLTPKVIRKMQENGRETVTIIPAQSRDGLPRACPMIYRPVTLTYEMTVENLYPGGRYDFSLFGSKKRVAVAIPER